jgi:hypothetical protein
MRLDEQIRMTQNFRRILLTVIMAGIVCAAAILLWEMVR